ncbi:hypothetical protein AMJ44_14855, partial [candidate division WOR-1 bacterium DG_54_3]
REAAGAGEGHRESSSCGSLSKCQNRPAKRDFLFLYIKRTLKTFYAGTGLVPVRTLKRTATRFDKLTVLSKVEGRAVPTTG